MKERPIGEYARKREADGVRELRERGGVVQGRERQGIRGGGRGGGTGVSRGEQRNVCQEGRVSKEPL